MVETTLITGLNTTWCQVSDMDRAIDFYRDVLGLTPGYTSAYWSEFDLGNGKIALHSRIEPGDVPCGDPSRGWMLGVRTSDIRALRAALAEAGAVIQGDYHETPSGVVLAFADLDGNPIQAIELGRKLADLG